MGNLQIILAGVASILQAGALLAANLPENLTPSQVPSPVRMTERLVETDRVGSGEQLRVHERNLVLHYVDLDRSPFNWSHRLLRLAVGFHEQWQPADFYALFPKGYESNEKETSAFIDTIMVRFGRRYKPDGPPLHSKNCFGYTLSQAGEYLVVAYRDQERWYFESGDGGDRWRLAKIGWAKHPTLFTELRYTNGQITEIIFPSGEAAKITYHRNLPMRIDTPWGETTLMEREAGLLTRLTIHRELPDGKLGKKPIREYHYEYGGDGKIARFVNSHGVPFTVESVTVEGEDKGLATVLYETTIRNELDGTFYVKRHHANEQQQWRIESSWGSKNDTPETAELEHLSRWRVVGKRWTRVSQARGKAESEENYELDKAGNPEVKVDAAGRTRMFKYDATGRPTKVTDAKGDVKQFTRNEFGQLTRKLLPDGTEQVWEYDEHTRVVAKIDRKGTATAYVYDDRGYCIETQRGDRTWRFEYDAWGRVVQETQPHGLQIRWQYDDYGQLVAVTHATVSASSRKPVVVRQKHYKYDDLGRLVEVADQDEVIGRYEYDVRSRLKARTKRDGIRVTYAWSPTGQLLSKRDPTGKSVRYQYHPNGKVKRSVTHVANQPRVTREYDHVGKLLSEHTAGQARIEYAYDRAGKRIENKKQDKAQ